jgi:hypothetical protein
MNVAADSELYLRTLPAGFDFRQALLEGRQDIPAEGDDDVVWRVKLQPALKIEPPRDFCLIDTAVFTRQNVGQDVERLLRAFVSIGREQACEHFLFEIVARARGDNRNRTISPHVLGHWRIVGLWQGDVMVKASLAD